MLEDGLACDTRKLTYKRLGVATGAPNKLGLAWVCAEFCAVLPNMPVVFVVLLLAVAAPKRAPDCCCCGCVFEVVAELFPKRLRVGFAG